MNPSNHREPSMLKPQASSLKPSLLFRLPRSHACPLRPAGQSRVRVGMFLLLLAALASPALAGPPGAAGDLYVIAKSETGQRQIQQYDGATLALVGTFVGPTDNGLTGLTFGPNGNLFVSDVDALAVVEFDGTTGAPLGTFTSGLAMPSPTKLTFGPTGNLFVIGGTNHRIVEFDGGTGALIGIFATMVGNDIASDLIFGSNGNLFVTITTGSGKVLEFDGTSGVLIGTFATPSYPNCLRFGPNGNLFVSSGFNGEVNEFDGVTGVFVRTFALLDDPQALTFGPDNSLLVAGRQSDIVTQHYGNSGALVRAFAVLDPPDLAFKPLVGPFPTPAITTFSPSQAENCMPVTVTLSGSGLAWGARPRLTR